MPKSKLFLVPKEPTRRQRVPNNLPLQSTPLIGREKEVEDTLGLLSAVADQAPGVRLLTLTGPGGVGKTRLALQVAEEALDEFEDGVYFVEMASITDPGLVAPAIAGVLQLREAPGISLVSTLIEYLQERRILLLLDNFEQVMPAGTMLAKLLASCPHLKLLVTSRSPLRLDAEREYAVLPLAVPEAGRHLSTSEASKYGAVELFVQRAGAIDPDFELTGSNAAAVAEVCRRVDGLPLAIELVAAHSRLLSPQSMLTRLANPLRLLSAGTKEAPARHKTIRDTIEWSYMLLGGEEQKLFRRLAVFVGGFSLRGAEAVCNETGDVSIEADHPQAIEVLEGMEALIDSSLVKRLKQVEEVGADEAERRLGMLETVRMYALGQLEASGEVEVLRRRHADYYVQLAEQIEPKLDEQDQVTWLSKLDRDHDNLRASLNWLLAQEKDETAEDAIIVLVALSFFWIRRAQYSEYEKWLEEALTQPGLAISARRISALKRASLLAVRQTDYHRARNWVEQAVAMARELGDKNALAGTYNTLGGVQVMQSDYESAQVAFEEALAIRRDLGDEGGISQALNNLGEVARYRGDYKRAEAFYMESLDLARKIADLTGDISGVLFATMNLGHAMSKLGKLREARTIFMESVALAQQNESPFVVAESLAGLVGLILADVDGEGYPVSRRLLGMEQATRLAGLAASLLERNGGQLDKLDQVEFDHNMATIRAMIGDAAFKRAWEEGWAMGIDQAQDLAARGYDEWDEGKPRRRGRPLKRVAGGLTGREYEVVSLLARGMTNAEIAAQLVLSVRTVDTHVANSMQKLGLHTRTELAAWAVRQGIVPESAGG